MQPKLDGESGGQKLDTIREALAATKLSDNENEDDDNESVGTVTAQTVRKNRHHETENLELWERPVKKRDAWDCQSVLSTYTNLENHPQMISDRGPRKKITINPKTGMPNLVEAPRKKVQVEESDTIEEDEEDEEESEDEEERINLGERRSKAESKEEKKARKAAVKEAKKVLEEKKFIGARDVIIALLLKKNLLTKYFFFYRIDGRQRNQHNKHLKMKKIDNGGPYDNNVKLKVLNILHRFLFSFILTFV